MATYYWVGGTGNWDNSNAANWSATSGGAGGAGIPTSADNIIFNASSGTGTVTVFSTAVCNDLTASAVTAATTFTMSTGPSVSGSVNFGASATITSSTYLDINLVATTTGKTFTCTATGFLGDLTFSGVGGGWTVSSAITCEDIYHTAGTLNTNGQTITIGRAASTFSSFSDSGSTTTRTLTLGASAINIGTTATSGTSVGWTITGTNLTLNANTSTITVGNTTAGATTGGFFYGGGKTYTTVSLRGTTINLYDVNTFTSLSRIGAADITSVLYVNANQTVTTTFILQGNNGTSTNTPNRLFVLSSELGTSRSITLTGTATRTVQEVDFADINLVFGSSVTGTRVGNCLGNTNITFTAARTLFARSAGAARSWSGTATALWATTTGGAAATANGPPLPQDSITLDATSGAAALTLDMPRLGSAFTATGFTGSLVNSAADSWIFGAITGAASVLNGRNVVIATRTNSTLTGYTGSSGATYIYSPGATIRLGATFTSTGSFILTAGTFDTNDGTTTYNLTAASFNGASTPTNGGFPATAGTVNLNSSTITLTSTGAAWRLINGNTINAGTSTIDITNNSATTKIFTGSGKTYYNLKFSGSTTCLYDIRNDNTFNDIINNCTVPITVWLPFGLTTTVSNLSLGGAKGRGCVIMANPTLVTATTTIAITQNISTSFLAFVRVIKSGASTLSASGVADLGGNTGITSTSATRAIAFNNAGATSFTVPTTIASSGSSAFITVGGGGGAGKRSTSTGASGGGGSGSTALASNLNITAGQTVFVTVGAAGVGATASGAGTAGGTSWVNISANSQPAALANGTFSAGGGGSAGVASTAGGSAGAITTAPTLAAVSVVGAAGNSGSVGGGGGASAPLIYNRSFSGTAGTFGGGGGAGTSSAASAGTSTVNGGAGGTGDGSTGAGTGGAGGNPPTAGGAGSGGGGGGGGGGSTAATVNSANGGAGSNSATYSYISLNGSPASGTIGPGGGGGGGGGISSTALSGSTGGNGGNGDDGGGGGGGGRGSTTSGATGNGGNGGTGLVLFIYEIVPPAGNRGFIIG